MAKNFIDNETIIMAEDANKWEGYEAKITALENKTNNASKSVAGIVKMADTVNDVTAENATSITGTSADDGINRIGTLANQNKIAINNIISVLKKAGIMSSK